MSSLKCYLFAFVLCFPVFYSFAQAQPLPHREFVIDTDVGIDDVLAIIYLLHRPEITVRAITIESDGNAHCNAAFNNLSRLLILLHKTEIPIACGRSTPFPGGHSFPNRIRNKFDTFLNGLLPNGNMPERNKLSAKELLMKTLNTAHQPVDILAIGPLTTIAEVLIQSNEIKNKIRMIYLMGGAINVPGNIIDVDPNQSNKVSEWNIYFDPSAARTVFKSNVPITLVPLDVTNLEKVDLKFYNQIRNHRSDTSVSNFIFNLLKRNKKMIFNNTWYFWDQMAAVISSDDSISVTKTLPLSVRISPEPLSGKTEIDENHGVPVRVCFGINSKKFNELLLNGFFK